MRLFGTALTSRYQDMMSALCLTCWPKTYAYAMLMYLVIQNRHAYKTCIGEATDV